jgi:hypothetical protein
LLVKSLGASGCYKKDKKLIRIEDKIIVENSRLL